MAGLPRDDRLEARRQGLLQPLLRQLLDFAGGFRLFDDVVDLGHELRLFLIHADVTRAVLDQKLHLRRATGVLLGDHRGDGVAGRDQIDLAGNEGGDGGVVVFEALDGRVLRRGRGQSLFLDGAARSADGLARQIGELGDAGVFAPDAVDRREERRVSRREIDHLFALGKNAEREKVIDFSAAYAPFFSAVYSVRGKDAGITKLADLAGKTVGAARGTIEEQALTATAPKDATIKRFEDNNATIAAFVSGQIDLVATGNTIAAVIAKQNPGRAPEMKFLIKDSPCYVGMNKEEPKLMAKVNDIIKQAKASGEIEKLSEKWLKQPLPPGF